MQYTQVTFAVWGKVWKQGQHLESGGQVSEDGQVPAFSNIQFETQSRCFQGGIQGMPNRKVVQTTTEDSQEGLCLFPGLATPQDRAGGSVCLVRSLSSEKSGHPCSDC